MSKEDARLWQAHEFDHLELLRASYITHSFDRHFHEEYAIGVFEQGAMTYYSGRVTQVFQASQILVINPRDIHYGHAANPNGWKYRMFYPSIALMRQIALEIDEDMAQQDLYFPLAIQDANLALLLSRAHSALENSTSPLERETYLRLAMGQLILKYAHQQPLPNPSRPNENAIQRVCEYMQQHYARDISLAEIAKLAHFSPFHLLRQFRAQMGLPPHQYLTLLRIEAAKRLIARGMPLKQVAVETGFTDQSHLTRRFKRIAGVTPGHYMAVS
jgi:AraC-like DNA-binding protein